MTTHQLNLADQANSYTWNILEVPLTESPVEGTSDIVTIDGNIATYFQFKKRQWSHRWTWMSKAEYEILKAFYDRQFTLNQYPQLTISELNIVDMPVRMTINPKNIIDNCGNVRDVQITFREANQLSGS